MILRHLSRNRSLALTPVPLAVSQNHARLLDSMELEEDSWVDPELREYFADVVYRVKWLDSQDGSGEVYLYLLFEHKSHSDRVTAYQILRYMMLKWNAHLKTETQQLPLPYIIPLVFYHGEANWTASRTFQGLFGDKIPAELQPYYTGTKESHGEIDPGAFELNWAFSHSLRIVCLALSRIAERCQNFFRSFRFYLDIRTGRAYRAVM